MAKILAVIPVLCIAILLLLLAFTTTPVNGYEFSLHTVYPAAVWILFGLIALYPLGYLALTHITKRFFSWKTAYTSLASAISNKILFLNLPLIRGYSAYGGTDSVTHFGYVVDILVKGFVTNNHYPFTHTADVIIVQLAGISKEMAAYHLSSVLVLIFLFSFILIGRCFFKNQKYTIVLVTLVSIPSALVLVLTPTQTAYCLLPLFLYIVYKAVFTRKNQQYLLLAMIIAITGWYIHPEFILFSLLFIATMITASIQHHFFSKKSDVGQKKIL